MFNVIAAVSEQGRPILTFGDSMLKAVLGYGVVFVGLILLMWVIQIVGKIMVAKTADKKAAKPTAPAAAPAPAAPVAAPVAPAAVAAPAGDQPAPGSAGEVRLYNTEPRDAAIIMAIVADKMQKPLNELKFVSIKEVK